MFVLKSRRSWPLHNQTSCALVYSDTSPLYFAVSALTCLLFRGLRASVSDAANCCWHTPAVLDLYAINPLHSFQKTEKNWPQKSLSVQLNFLQCVNGWGLGIIIHIKHCTLSAELCTLLGLISSLHRALCVNILTFTIICLFAWVYRSVKPSKRIRFCS